jgi:Xaa-Pro aminopeptidase
VGDLLLHGDTERMPALRHEVPLAIMDPFTLVEVGGRTAIMTSALEVGRVEEVRPDADIVLIESLGYLELVAGGTSEHEAEPEMVARFVQHVGLREAIVPPELSVAIADRLRQAGIVLHVDGGFFERRRRVKTPTELEGIRRAQRSAEAGMKAAAAMLRSADPVDDRLLLGGEVLTAEQVRDALRTVCSAHGAPAPPDVLVTSALSGSGGHDPGSGPLPAHLPIEVDVWPRDEATGCWTDMTRTFVAGEISDEVAGLRDTVRDALERVRAATRPGITGRELFDIAATVVEGAGHPTQRTREPGEVLDRGFRFSLGHGVGLEVHEPPWLGLAGHEPLVAGDVLAVEPGIELPEVGGVRYEDLLLVTEKGCETLTDYPYDLRP